MFWGRSVHLFGGLCGVFAFGCCSVYLAPVVEILDIS